MKRTKHDKRPSSDNFVDLHIFVVPHELWMEKYRTTYNNSTLESISAGFVRVAPSLNMCDLRSQITEQLDGGSVLTGDYVFLRCVGRCLAVVSKHQEYSLKVKHFLPPVVPSPELFVLLGTHETLSYSIASSFNDGSEAPDYVVRRYVNDLRENNEDSRCSSRSGHSHREDSHETENERKSSLENENIKRRVHFETPQFGNDGKNTTAEGSSPSFRNSSSQRSEMTSEQMMNKSDSPQNNEIEKNENNEDDNEMYADTEGDRRLEVSFDDTSAGRRRSSSKERQSSSKKNSTELENKRKQDWMNKTETQTAAMQKDNDEPGVSMKQDTVNTNMNQQHDGPVNKSTEDNEVSNVKPRKANKPLLHSKTAPAFFTHVSSETKKEDYHNKRNSEGAVHEAGTEDDVTEVSQSLGDHKGRPALRETVVENNETIAMNNNEHFKDQYTLDNNDRDFTKKEIGGSEEGTSIGARIPVNQTNHPQNIINQKENDLNLTLGEKENLVLQLQEELNAIRNERSSSEKKREHVLKKAKHLQNQNNQKRVQARNVWKKRYFEEKKVTVSLEEKCNQLRYDVDVLHKKILSSVDSKDAGGTNSPIRHDGNPSMVNNKVLLTRKENEVEELKRRVEEAKIKLGSEMKLRDNAQKELKQIRDEVIDKKINATLVKKSLSLLETRPSNTQI